MAGPSHLTPQEVLTVVDARRIKASAEEEWATKEEKEKGPGPHLGDFMFWVEAARIDKRLQAVRDSLAELSTESLKELQTLMYAGRDGGWRGWPEEEWDKQPWKRWSQAVEGYKSTNGMDRNSMIHTIGEKSPLNTYLYLGIEGMGLGLGWTTILQWMDRPERLDRSDEYEEDEEN